MRRALLSIVATLALGAILAAAEPTPATVKGRVVDREGRPVAGAVVVFYRTEGREESETLTLESSTGTSADGAFAFGAELDGVAQGYIAASKEGLAHGWLRWYRGQPADAVMTLRHAAQIAGTIVDEKGLPIAGATVGAEPYSDDGDDAETIADRGEEPVIDWLASVTDARGRFVLKDLPEGAPTRIRAVAPGRAEVYVENELASSWKAQRYPIRPPSADVRITLPQESVVTGLAIDKNTGRPVARARLRLFIPGHMIVAFETETVSGDDGAFRFGHLRAGRYILHATAPESTGGLIAEEHNVTTAAGEEISDVRIEFARTGTLQVRAIDEATGAIVSDAYVIYGHAGSRESTGAPADGGLRTLHLVPGDYWIEALRSADLGTGRAGLVSEVTLKPGQTVKVDARVRTAKAEPGAAADKTSVTVRDEEGRTVPGAEVTFWPSLSLEPAYTDEEGRVEIARRPRCELMVRSPEKGLAAVVSVGQDDKALDVTLRRADKVVGRVTDPDGKAVSGAKVTLALRVRRGFAWNDCPIAENVGTDAEGRYEVPAVTNPNGGALRLEAIAAGYSLVGIPVRAGSVKDYLIEADTIILKPCTHTVSGRVENRDGEPVEGVALLAGMGLRSTEIRGMDGAFEDQPVDAVATSDRDGRFTIRGVTAGKVRIAAVVGIDELGAITVDADSTDARLVVEAPSRRQREPEAVNTVGKPLPSLDGLDVRPALGDTAGKLVLVCVFDMESRPSRQMVKTLAARAEEMRAKGVVVVCVSAGAADAAAVRAWADKNGVPYPVGASAEGLERTAAAWGGSGIPWLVLADKGHTVVATGATLDDVKERLDGIGR